MGRHSLPDRPRRSALAPRPRARRRNAAIVTATVLAVAASTVAAVQGGLLSFGSSCQGGEVRVRIAAAPAIAPALVSAADHAHRHEVTSDGRCLDVRVTAREAYQVADALRSKATSGTDFEVWVPDSDLWVHQITADARAEPVTQVGNIASTPVGVAVIPSAAKSLGWPSKTYTWTELADTAMTSDRLRLGAGDPARSATGLLALTRLTDAAERAKDGDTRVAAMTRALSQRTAETDRRLLATLPRDLSDTEQGDPQRNQALFLSEQAAFAYNAEADSGDDLDLFYPEDGSPRLDYPFALIDENRLTTDQSRAALRFMTLLGEADGREILGGHGFRTAWDETPEALVTQAGGRSPQPYGETAAAPAREKDVQEALGLWTITVQSDRITTVVDASASMAKPVPGTDRSRMDVTKASLVQALATFTADDEIGLWKFSTRLDGNRDYRVLVPTEQLGDRKGDGTQRDKLSAAVRDLEPVPGGPTGLYDTTLAAYREAVASYGKGKFNALVILTDGVNEDPGSISRSRLITELRKLTDPDRPVPLIAIAVGPDADKDEVDQIAKATGGSGHQISDPAQIHSVILKAIVQAARQS
ncbi:substrate-binding and VWA domain-containing protein [Streptomyces sporangiiformans]|uniref:VWA domain-containing protein n=1 Tax=Streptomyces sporangiiformans TaxID=2315329 RepID=A0A505CVZ1_9ACTN|nr:substrate-binding and VWA domain-containing protein [Streptomyces sporangiiformans]TPQ15734.1 VWA domain-containing protein [Streptomyces sporangiiformans]